MSFADERAAIEGRFAANWPFTSTVPIAYENVPFDPPYSGGDYVTCLIKSGKGDQASLQDNPMFRYVGIIQNNIVCGKDKGSVQARIYADALTGIWRRQKFALGFSGYITTYTPSFIPIGVKDGRYWAVVSTPYHRDEFQSAGVVNIPGGGPPLGPIVQYIPTGAINGINTVFNLPKQPISVLSTFVFLSGVLQLSPANFSLSGSTITFVVAPTSGSTIAVYF